MRDNAVIRYLRETRAELRKVSWPTRAEAWGLTKIVLGVTISMAAFLGLVDYLFSLELAGVVNRDAWAIGIAVICVVASVVVVVILRRRAEY